MTSQGWSCAWTACRAGSRPKENRAGMKESPCSPPSACVLVCWVPLRHAKHIRMPLRTTISQRGGTYWLLVCGGGRSTYYFVRLYRRHPQHQWIGLCCCCCFVLSPSVHVRPPLCQHAWTVRIGGGHRLRGTGWQKLGRCNVRRLAVKHPRRRAPECLH